ncbi:protein kinase C-binding protein NELL2-like [Haliotis cracherodii]|uniref:protein kinase C-binding protein NELL2-like n=1 Tax=Haliotis cracherodii TaxID=6455 RepID=UPI0039EC837E
MDKGAVNITEWSEKGKNMLLFRVPPYLPLLVLTCWAVLHGVSGACSNNDDCKHSGKCDTPKKICNCTGTGYDGDNCEKDIDECVPSAHSCDTNADCTNTEGSFTCTCKSDYVGDGETCTGKYIFKGVCSEGGTECINGGACDTSSTPTKCKCADGYTGDTCQNVGGTVKISAYLMALTVLTLFVIL